MGDDDDDDGGMAAAQKANVLVEVEVSWTSKLAFGLGFRIGVDGLVVRVKADTTPETGPKSRLAVLGVAVDRGLGALGVLKPLSKMPVHSGVPSPPARSVRRLLLLVILPQKLRNFSLTGFRMDSLRVRFMDEAKEHMESSAAASLPKNVDASATELLRGLNVFISGSATKLTDRRRVLEMDPVRMSLGFLVLVGRAKESTDIRDTLSKLSRLRFRSFSVAGRSSSVSRSHSLMAFRMGEMFWVVPSKSSTMPSISGELREWLQLNLF